MNSVKEVLSSLPDSCGVYIIRDENGKEIYIGKSTSIKKRVFQHYLKSPFKEKIFSVDYILTQNELSALILEASLIKKYKPKYNVSMRDDKQYPYVKLTMDEEYPRLVISRRIENDKGVYFGPYKSVAARLLIKIVSRVFGLRSCSSKTFKKKTQPCLNFYIKRCNAPCAEKISKQKYMLNVKKAKMFLQKGPEKLLESLNKEMEKASKNLDFEKAAEIRDKIFSIQKLLTRYDDKNKPMSNDFKSALDELQKMLSLSSLPKRIEAFDISNLGKSLTVGAMVVFLDGKPYKDHYRKFKIRTESLPNDVAAIYEVVFRRFSGTLKNKLPNPDILLIDGGIAQLNSAARALSDAKVDGIKVISLAKEKEMVYTLKDKNPINIPKNSKAKIFLKAIIDEVHRFAITFHRSLRKKYLLEENK